MTMNRPYSVESRVSGLGITVSNPGSGFCKGNMEVVPLGKLSKKMSCMLRPCGWFNVLSLCPPLLQMLGIKPRALMLLGETLTELHSATETGVLF